jgi:hypothetical protein
MCPAIVVRFVSETTKFGFVVNQWTARAGVVILYGRTMSVQGVVTRGSIQNRIVGACEPE